MEVPAAAGPRRLAAGLTVCCEPGTITCVVGPNGAGKSTLLRIAAGLGPPAAGTVRLDEAPVHTWPPRDRARALAYLPQRVPLTEDLTVRDLVALGRHPHRRWPLGTDPNGDEAVRRALRRAGIEHLAARGVFSLSGGEFQLARIARLLATQARILVLDEPTTALDPAHALAIADLLAALAHDGRALLVAIHDLELARRIASCVVCLGGPDAPAVHLGSPHEVLVPEVLDRVYGVRTRLWPDAIAFHPAGRSDDGAGPAAPVRE